MPRPRCGAPLPANSDKRRKHDTCRHIVHEHGDRCHRHPLELPAYAEAMAKVFK